MNKATTKRNNRFKRKPRYKHRKPKPSAIDVNKYISKPKEVKAHKVYETENTFSDFQLSPILLNKVSGKGYKRPSEIQDKTIPHILEGNDIIGIAGTGTGKTAAFLIPVIQRLLEKKMDHYALIITPTRELANQINDEFRSLTKGLGLFSTCLIGGSSVSEAIKSLRRTNHLIIGTPGRMQDMIDRGLLPLKNFKVLVLDEFDRMLDMGFSKEIQKIEAKMRNRSQTLLFSATLDPTQKSLVAEMTKEPIQVKAGPSTQQTHSIDQDVVYVGKSNKFELVHELIERGKKTILFCETKRTADKMMGMFKKENIQTDVIHGDKTQRAREVALRKFKTGKIDLLVATDVLARGIDVSDVELVINYEVPQNYNDYIHRIGRTGRAGKQGRAITLID